jgi:hypothetical protein
MLYWTYGVILNPGKLSAKYLAEHIGTCTYKHTITTFEQIICRVENTKI